VIEVDRIRGGLVVSCQPLPDEPDDPMRDPYVQARVASAAVMGGAVGIRCNSPADVAAIRSAVSVPVIGLWKDGSGPVSITPKPRHAIDLVTAGADIVAVDATDRPRPAPFAEVAAAVHAADALVLADIATERDAAAAVDDGADLVATTLSGYTAASKHLDGPDLRLLERLAGRLTVPVIAEGRYRTTDDVTRAFAAGAHAVVVGNSISSPLYLTRRMVHATPRGTDLHGKVPR
jgi:N-acylglucosamine-6-phosphate 2-epimerase